MRFTDIARVAKQDKTAVIVTDYNRQQWCQTKHAIYRLEGLLEMTSDDFLNLIGVLEDKKEDWERGELLDDAGWTKQDRPGEMELTADPAGLSVCYNGKCLTPFYVPGGVVWMDEELLAPIRRQKADYIRFFLRNERNGRCIAVKDGLILIAVIAAYRMEDVFFGKINTLWQQCSMQRMQGEVRIDESGDDDICNGEGTESGKTMPEDAGNGGEDGSRGRD